MHVKIATKKDDSCPSWAIQSLGRRTTRLRRSFFDRALIKRPQLTRGWKSDHGVSEANDRHNAVRFDARFQTVGEVRKTSDKTLLSLQDLGLGSVAHLRETLGSRSRTELGL
jgi:hypothetical protein